MFFIRVSNKFLAEIGQVSIKYEYESFHQIVIIS